MERHNSIFDIDTKRFKHVIEFESIDACVRFSDKAPRLGTRDESDESSTGFTGTENLKEAQALALGGWKEGTRKIEKLARRLDYVIADYRYDMVESDVYDVAGHCVDIGAFLDGEPECMLSTEIKMDLARTATIFLNGAYSCGVGKDEVFRRGALVCQLVDTLERLGVRVDLSIITCIEGLGNAIIGTRVKRPNDILDMDRIAYVCAHRSWFRRIGFKVMEAIYPTVPTSYGYPTNLKPEEMPKDALYLDTDLGEYLTTDAEAAEWLKKMVEQYLKSSQHA